METVSLRSPESRTQSESPTLSLIVPCFKVARYLPDFFASLDKQTVSVGAYEIIFVIDGCPENSERLVKEWASTTDASVTVVVQDNQGLSAARNTGIRYARGVWVTFPDPDDELAPDYLARVITAVTDYPAEDLFVTRLCLTGPNGRAKSHPLDFKFADETSPRIVSLIDEPEKIHLQAASAFFRRTIFKEKGTWFSSELRINFEDAHLIARILMSAVEPRYVLVPGAFYFYKQRSDGSSLVAQAEGDYTRYINLSEEAYLPLLKDCSRERPAPQWLGNLLLYDMWWLFRASRQMQSTVFAMGDEERDRINELFHLVLERIGRDTIRAFRVVNIPEQTRAAWEVAATGALSESPVLISEYDRQLGLRKIIFFAPSAEVGEVSISGPHHIEILFHKPMSVEILGQVWVYEHILWIKGVCNGELENFPEDFALSVKGQSLFAGGQPIQEYLYRRAMGIEQLERARPVELHEQRWSVVSALRARIARLARRANFSLSYRLGNLTGFSRRFRNAWVLMDRDTQAHDNAEALYRYISADRPDINAWFVIGRDSADFKRLRSEGFRVVAYGSRIHFLLMKHAAVLASSQADHYVLEPFARDVLTKSWVYVFLQHGVVHNSLHRWLNPKDIQILVASTQAEYDAFVQHGGLYKFSSKEVRLTEMPRGDELIRLARDRGNSETRRTIVVMPTWRNYLLRDRVSGGNERRPIDGFYESEFVREWDRFLNGQAMSQLASSGDFEVFLLPHPNIDEHWKNMRLPRGVTRISYTSGKAQEVLSRATLTVTDYSSQAFEGAFVGAPTVYFQFDREDFFSGVHIAAPGYFSHERDGFGPVCSTFEEAESSLIEMAYRSHRDYGVYQERVSKLFPYRDGRASERVVKAIEEQLN